MMPASRVAESYSIVSFFQVAPAGEDEVARHLERACAAGAAKGRIAGHGLYRSMGKHDLVLELRAAEVRAGLKFLYSTIEWVNREPGAGGSDIEPGAVATGASPCILDYHKVVGFQWQPPDAVAPGLPTLCCTLLKLNRPLHAGEGAVEVEQGTVADLAEIAARMGVGVRVLGTFGWDELLCFFHGRKFEDVVKALDRLRLRRGASVFKLSSIPLVGPGGPAAIPDDWLHSTSFFTLQAGLDEDPDEVARHIVRGLLDDPETRAAKAEQRQEDGTYKEVALADAVRVGRTLGPQDSILWVRGRMKFGVANALKRSLRAHPEVAASRTFLTLPPVTRQALPPGPGPSPPAAGAGAPSPAEPDLATLDLSDDAHDSPKLRLHALRNLITGLRLSGARNPYQLVFPAKLVEHLDQLVRRGSPGAAASVLSDLHMAVQQRLSGSELGAVLGETTGALELLGGRQRMVYAAEGVAHAAFLHSVEKAWWAWEGAPPRSPVILTVFDHPFPQAMRGQQLREPGEIRPLPLWVIRQGIAHYQPLRWIFGSVHETCHYIPAAPPVEETYRRRLLRWAGVYLREREWLAQVARGLDAWSLRPDPAVNRGLLRELYEESVAEHFRLIARFFVMAESLAGGASPDLETLREGFERAPGSQRPMRPFFELFGAIAGHIRAKAEEVRVDVLTSEMLGKEILLDIWEEVRQDYVQGRVRPEEAEAGLPLDYRIISMLLPSTPGAADHHGLVPRYSEALLAGRPVLDLRTATEVFSLCVAFARLPPATRESCRVYASFVLSLYQFGIAHQALLDR